MEATVTEESIGITTEGVRRLAQSDQLSTTNNFGNDESKSGLFNVTGKVHNFKRHQFRTPVKCFQCSEFIWGLASVGYVCQDCGFTAHQFCIGNVSPNCTEHKEEKNEPRVIVRVKKTGDEIEKRNSFIISNRASLSTPEDLLEKAISNQAIEELLEESDDEDSDEARVEKIVEAQDQQVDHELEVPADGPKDKLGDFLQLVRTKGKLLYDLKGYEKVLSSPSSVEPEKNQQEEGISEPVAQTPLSPRERTSSNETQMAHRRRESLFAKKLQESELDFLVRLTRTSSSSFLLEDLQKRNIRKETSSPSAESPSLNSSLDFDNLSIASDDEFIPSSPSPSPISAPTSPVSKAANNVDFPLTEQRIRELATGEDTQKPHKPLSNISNISELNVTPSFDTLPSNPILMYGKPETPQTSLQKALSSSTQPESPKSPRLAKIKSTYQLYEEPVASVGRTRSMTNISNKLRPRSNTNIVTSQPVHLTRPRPIGTVSAGTSLQYQPKKSGNRPKSSSFSNKELPKKTAKLIEDLFKEGSKETDLAEKQWLAQGPGLEADAVISIEVKLDKDEYVPGDSITGTLYLDLLKPLRYTDGVKVLFQGFEKAYKGGVASEIGKKGKNDYQMEMFFKHKLSLWEPSEKHPALLPGQHSWSFSFELPVNLPPTVFFEDWLSIVYQCRGYVDPGNVKKVGRQAITTEKLMFDVYGVNTQMWKTIVFPITQPVIGSRLSTKNNVRLVAQVERKDYYVGEKIKLSVKIDNQTEKDILASMFKISLIQEIKIHVKSWHCEFEPSKLNSQSFKFKGFNLKQKSTAEKTFELIIPDEDDDESPIAFPSTTGLLFTIVHFVKITSNIRGMKPLLIPIRLWDSCWDNDRKSIPIPARKPSVTIAPTNWKFQTVKVWSKPLKELPVSIDLPRLVTNTTLIGPNGPEPLSNPVLYREATEEWVSTYTKYQSPFGELNDLTFQKGDIFEVIDENEIEHENKKWFIVESGEISDERPIGLIPSEKSIPIPSPLKKEESILGILTTLASKLEGPEKAEKIQNHYWRYIPHDLKHKGDRDISRELNRFLAEIMGEESRTVRVLKACNQSVIAPAVIELTLNVCSKISFKDGGGWRIKIQFIDENLISITHAKKQRHVPRRDEPELFTFEWELTFVLERTCESIIEFSFVLSNVEWNPNIEEHKREEINFILERYFKYGPSESDREKVDSIFPYAPRQDSLWAKRIQETKQNPVPEKSVSRSNSASHLAPERLEKAVSKFFAVSNSQLLRDMDIVHDNRDTKLQNLSKYIDEDEELYEALSAERKAKITLEEKIRRKWMKTHEQLLVATLLPGVYKKIEISTSDGLTRLSPFYSNVTTSSSSKSKSILSFLESLAILLSDVKETLPNLIRHWNLEQESTPHYLGKFFQDYISEDCKTMKLLKAINLSVMASAFSLLKEHLHKKFPFTDIGSAWKIAITIGTGDGTTNDYVVVTHTKAAKSLDNSTEGSFEFMWQLTLKFDYSLRDLKSVNLKIPNVQVSSRFPKQKFKELMALVKSFNELDHSMSTKKTPQSSQNHYTTRKKFRQKLRKIPQADLSNPTLRKDCVLNVKVIEAKGFEDRLTRQKKRSSSILNKLATNISNDAGNCNPYCTLKLGDQRERTRVILNSNRPFWSEEYAFEVYNPLTQSLKVVLWNAQSFTSDINLGFSKLPLKVLLDQESREEWYPLYMKQEKESTQDGTVTSNPSGSKRGSMVAPDPNQPIGQIRLRLKYSEEIVLPGPLYDEMLELLVEPDLKIVKLLGRVIEGGEDREHVILSLIKIFEEKTQAVHLLNSLTEDEIRKTNNPDIIFRGNSVASRALDTYMKFIGQNYLSTTLSPIVGKINAYRKSCEIDPNKIDKSGNVEANVKKLENFTLQVLTSIFESVENCPTAIRECFQHLQETVQKYYRPEQVEITRYTCVSGYLFLRFFCPALMGPKMFHLMESSPDMNATRTLMLIAKIVQKIANMTSFDSEDYLKPMNKLVTDNLSLMQEFIDKISTVPENAPPRVRPPISLEKELASIHRYLKRHKDVMLKQQTEHEQTAMKKLLAVLENLEYISQHEKVTTYPTADLV